jgi:hypothetical protein
MAPHVSIPTHRASFLHLFESCQVCGQCDETVTTSRRTRMLNIVPLTLTKVLKMIMHRKIDRKRQAAKWSLVLLALVAIGVVGVKGEGAMLLIDLREPGRTVRLGLAREAALLLRLTTLR